MTAVDVMTASPLVFDNTKMEIKAKHILASSGYPIYGFPWIKVEDNVYARDGSLLSNTPVREVLDVSPRNDKNIFIVENYPRKIKRLPSNMAEVESRAKDIIFSDKNMIT
jgi:NTE family protein